MSGILPENGLIRPRGAGPKHVAAFRARFTAATVLASAPRPTRIATPSISSSITPAFRAAFRFRGYDPVIDALGLRRSRCRRSCWLRSRYHRIPPQLACQRRAGGEQATLGNGAHIAFEVEERAVIDIFPGSIGKRRHRRLAPEGLSPENYAHCYAAVVRDPD
jgi:hypothetical protein